LLFLGDDNLPPPHMITQMLNHIRQGRPVVTGLYFSRSLPLQPMIWKDEYLQGGCWDWHIGDIIQIYAAGCDALMINMDYVKDKIEMPWFSHDYRLIPPALESREKSRTHLTEDFYFYAKLKDAGIPVFCDTGIIVGHQDRESGIIYSLPMDYPQAKPGSEIPRKKDILIADIGAGLRPDPLHLTGDVVRFDINPKNKPDVLCDVRTIPEPDNKYDLVLASHILEHLRGMEAAKALSEWVRILKVGGKIIVRVPNIKWAMKRILEMKHTEYDLMMLYGMQTDNGQVHYNGFWAESLGGLAQMVTELGEIKIAYTGGEGAEESEITLTATKVKSKVTPILSEAFEKDEQFNSDRPNVGKRGANRKRSVKPV